VAELLRFLSRSPEWSNTYVIITADHGEAFGEHHTYTHGWDLHREVLHVPLIMVGPGIPPGVRISHIARTRQIFPTVLELAGVRAPILHRTSLSRMWNANYVPNSPDEATLSEVVDATPPPVPQGEISIITRDWQFIYQRGHGRSSLYHWTTDPLEQHDVLELAENQATMDALKARIFSIVERSYRPWRDTRYLVALSAPNFPTNLEAVKFIPSLPGGPLLPRGSGAVQTLFPPNPETPPSDSNKPDQELLRSIPYDGAP
jgi:arylsulfatase A-like enzyme